MFDEDFFNSLLQLPGDNLWLTHSTNWNYRTRLLKKPDYLLGFVSLNKYSFKITINKKWLENQSNLKENKYESPTFVYCKETYTMVPLLRTSFKTPLRMQGSWNDDDVETSEAMVKSSRGVDNKLGLNIEGFPQYNHRQSH